jgi:hypothetical protein
MNQPELVHFLKHHILPNLPERYFNNADLYVLGETFPDLIPELIPIIEFEYYHGSSTRTQWLKVAQGDLVNDDFNRNDRYHVLYWCCRLGYLSVAQYVVQKLELNATDVRSRLNCLLYTCCEGHHLKMAQWLVEQFNLTLVDVDQSHVFECVCESGYLEIAQWLFEKFEIDPSNQAFINCCNKGHLNVARWLYQQKPYDQQVMTYALAECSDGGHIPIAQWLHGCSVISNDRLNDAFMRACLGGHIQLAQWLIQYDLTVSKSQVEYLLRDCSQNGWLELAQWLVTQFDLKTTDLQSFCGQHSVRALTRSCNYEHIDIADWLINYFNLSFEDVEFSVQTAPSSVVEWAERKFGRKITR